MTPDQEPWGVSPAAYVRRMAEGYFRSTAKKLLGKENQRQRNAWLRQHRHLVENALAEGKAVPAEVLHSYPDFVPKSSAPVVAVPTPQDIDNARIRWAIAERQETAWVQCFQWALAAFGPGWLPSHRHYLATKEEEKRVRSSGERPQAAATVFTVKNAAGVRRHFMVENGKVMEHESYEAGFGDKLLEPHPTRMIEVRGQLVHPYHYSLCFAPYILYEPKTAEQLAQLRASRETKRAEREDQKWADNYPLFAQAGIRRDG